MNLLLLLAALGLAGLLILKQHKFMFEKLNWNLVPLVCVTGALPLEVDKVCQPHTRPWQVYLHGVGTSCSGALVDQSWIVTSFTCAYS